MMTNMDFSATKNAHEIQKNCMFQNMLAILCGWTWNEKLQEEAMELHLGDACCKSFENFRKNKNMKGVKRAYHVFDPSFNLDSQVFCFDYLDGGR